jgi:hypothetical protein
MTGAPWITTRTFSERIPSNSHKRSPLREGGEGPTLLFLHLYRRFQMSRRLIG